MGCAHIVACLTAWQLSLPGAWKPLVVVQSY